MQHPEGPTGCHTASMTAQPRPISRLGKTYAANRGRPLCQSATFGCGSRRGCIDRSCLSRTARPEHCHRLCAARDASLAAEQDDELEWDLPAGAEPSAAEIAAMEDEARRFAEQAASAEADASTLWEAPEGGVGEQPLTGLFEPKKKRGERRAGRAPDSVTPLHALPKLAIVGRPNVGKSALFNRITSSNLAIVYDYPGVTRDRQYTRAVWGGREFVVVDTGGLMSDAAKLPADKRALAIRGISDEDLPQAIERQAAAGVAEADSLLLVMDGQSGLTATDQEIVDWLRRTHSRKPVTLAVNKCENIRTADTQAADFWHTGHEPIAVSAISGTGTGDMMDRVAGTLPPPKAVAAQEDDRRPISLAIVGRPNVGKSSLLNALVGDERAIVSPVSGTTRDAIDTEVVTPDGQRFTLIDTAGIRKRASVSDSLDGAEPLSVQRALHAVRRSQVAVLVLDAAECTAEGRFVVTQQDYRLSELIAAEGRACVVVANKWDAVADKDSRTLDACKKELLAQLRLIDWATVVFASALSGQRVRKILEAAAAASEEHNRRISTATLNMVVRETVNWRAPPTSRAGKKGRVYYATQAAVRPPTFVFFVNDVQVFGEDYRKYVERQLRENVGFPGSPLRVFWRGKAPTRVANGRQ